MTLLRFLIPLAVVVALAWWFFGRRRNPPGIPPRRERGAGTPAAMVTCAHCGVHFPRADALEDARGRLYCSEAHRDAGAR